jgi:hypothetical protein
MSEGWLLFVSKPTGYELRERDGDPPALGDEVEDGDLRLVIMKLGPSPLPGDGRTCAFTQPSG